MRGSRLGRGPACAKDHLDPEMIRGSEAATTLKVGGRSNAIYWGKKHQGGCRIRKGYVSLLNPSRFGSGVMKTILSEKKGSHFSEKALKLTEKTIPREGRGARPRWQLGVVFTEGERKDFSIL